MHSFYLIFPFALLIPRNWFQGELWAEMAGMATLAGWVQSRRRCLPRAQQDPSCSEVGRTPRRVRSPGSGRAGGCWEEAPPPAGCRTQDWCCTGPFVGTLPRSLILQWRSCCLLTRLFWKPC